MPSFHVPSLLELWRRGSGLRNMKGSLLLVIVFVQALGSVWSQSEQQTQCPKSCECSDAARTVKCVNKSLKEVPKNLPSYVKNLFITYNNIHNVQEGSFNEVLTNLTNLSLSSNHLQELGRNTFRNLPGLQHLDLSNNKLANISDLSFQVGGGLSSPLLELNLRSALFNESMIFFVAGALQNGSLSNLQKLSLSGNNLMYLPTDMFASLPSLTHLDLSNNSLVSLRSGIFTNLDSLDTLDLRNNSLKNLRNATLLDFSSQPALSVFLKDNSWVCTCEIEPFLNWLKDMTIVKDSSSLLCSEPEKMRNISLLSVKISELECPPYPDDTSLQTSYVFLGIVLALIGVIFLLVLYLNRKGIKKWIYNIRDACRDHMEGYHYRYEINADPRLTNLSTNSDV
ncbi:trophoblast glycoprotein [Bufo gargarizans]|uniref:trophoblast glycoprotein n=1 Tax=Bufo gargarizans TaxID=30331 RepID=UPI001CF17D1B|nr:trophoblast glycoprotein [Bufo gargarizans]